MSSRRRKPGKRAEIPTVPLFKDLEPEVVEVVRTANKLKLDPQKLAAIDKSSKPIEGIPRLVLPTRWEYLQPKVESNNVSLKTIIRPVHQAMKVISEIVEYLRVTGGCQVLIIRADTGSGKTTFLNTLPLYMTEIDFHKLTIDLQTLSEEEFSGVLWGIHTPADKISLIILEGREKPESITDKYIQIVIANINRFARERRTPTLFVIPTIEEQVARNWCEHGSKVGDLIPQQKLYDGSRWYNYPGVPREKFVEIAEETVRALNPPLSLLDFGVSADELKSLAETAPTIGRYIEILATRIADRRRVMTLEGRGQREHVWIVYCSPDNRHYDHTWLVIDGFAQDEKLKLSPVKLVPSDSDTPLSKHWRQEENWKKLVATINFLDVRLINLPITTVVTAALTYGDEHLLDSFKSEKLINYKEQIPREMWTEGLDWDGPLVKRRLQVQNARDSLERTNLFRLLKGLPAEQKKGGRSEEVLELAQFLHLRTQTTESDLHYYVGRALQDLLEYHQFPNFIGIESEMPLISGQMQPIPDVTVHTSTDRYSIEFHFVQQQIASSQVARYALEKVIEKYMRSMPLLSSFLDKI